MRNTTHKQQEIENQKAKIRSEQEKMRASKRRLQQLSLIHISEPTRP